MSSLWPETCAASPPGSVVPATISLSACEALPRSPRPRLAETIATRSCAARRISAGPTASETSATAASDTGWALPGFTIRLRTSSIEEACVSTLRTRTSIFLSRHCQRVATSPRMLPTTRSATSRTARPSCVTRSWSNTMRISGVPASIVERTSVKRSSASIRALIASAALRSPARS